MEGGNLPDPDLARSIGRGGMRLHLLDGSLLHGWCCASQECGVVPGEGDSYDQPAPAFKTGKTS